MRAGGLMARAPVTRGSGRSVAAVASMELTGGAQLEAALRALGTSAEVRKAAEAALRPGATLIARKARQLAPRRSGKLRKAIKVAKMKNVNVGRFSSRQRRTADLAGTVTLTIGIDASVDPGTPAKSDMIHSGKRKGNRRGGSGLVNSVSTRAAVTEAGSMYRPAVPFMRPAFNENKAEAFRLVGMTIWPAIEKTAQRVASRRAARAARLLR